MVDLQKIKSLQFLSCRDIQKCLHISHSKARRVMEMCRRDAALSGYESLQGCIHYKRIFKFMGIEP